MLFCLNTHCDLIHIMSSDAWLRQQGMNEIEIISFLFDFYTFYPFKPSSKAFIHLQDRFSCHVMLIQLATLCTRHQLPHPGTSSDETNKLTEGYFLTSIIFDFLSLLYIKNLHHPPPPPVFWWLIPHSMSIHCGQIFSPQNRSEMAFLRV